MGKRRYAAPGFKGSNKSDSTPRQGDFHIEFIIHPGWQDTSKDALEYAMHAIDHLHMKGMIVAKAYDYEPSLIDLLEKAGWQRTGEFLLLVKEHWLKAKKSRRLNFEYCHITGNCQTSH